jgi:hypothetical protein
MNGLLAGSLSLLWLSAGQVPAEPATPPSAPIVTLGKPVIKLGKPSAIDPKTVEAAPGRADLDRNVQPVTYSPSTDVLIRRQPSPEPLPLPRNAVIENSSPLYSDPAPDLGPMPRVGASPAAPLSTAPMPSIVPSPSYSGGSIVSGEPIPGGPIYGAPGGPMGQPVPQGGIVNYGPPTLVNCDPDDCDACEQGKRRLLPFFEGGCTDYGNPPSRFWVSAEYLLWQVKNQRIPPLVTTSPPGTPQSAAGVLPAATTLFPPENGSFFDGLRSGGRFTFGMWFCEDQCLGIESSSFFLGQRNTSSDYSSGGIPILARPFTNVPTSLIAPLPGQLSELVAYPGVVSGIVSVRTSSQLYGTELDLRSNLWRGCCWRLDLLGGFRYVGLKESLDITENLIEAANGFNPGGPVMVHDSFQTTNNFYGGQIGLDMGFKRGRWSLDLLGKIAIGDMHESVRIEGSTAFPGLATSAPGGFLALPSNIGSFDRNRLAFVPEGGIKLGFQATQHCRLFVGYSFLYLSDVVRPGDQIDTRVDLRQVPVASFATGGGPVPGVLMPPAVLPANPMKRSDFWAQGVNFGVEFKF